MPRRASRGPPFLLTDAPLPMRLSPTASRSRPLRTLASALAALVFAGPLLGSAHEASVGHVVCAQHGELVESSGGPRHVEPPRTASGSYSSETDASAPSTDDHCLIAAHARHRSLEPGAVALEAPRLAAPLAPAAAAGGPPRSQPLYRLAPKGSPPARA